MGSDVTVRLAEGYLHLMQAFRTGPLYTTTVFDVGANGGKFKAVHSRHEYFTVPVPGATSSPEQVPTGRARSSADVRRDAVTDPRTSE